MTPLASPREGGHFQTKGWHTKFFQMSHFFHILRGGSGPKFSKTFSEITVDPKVPPDGPTFWSGLEARNILAPAWRPRPFSRQSLFFFQKNVQIMISHHNGCVMAKKRMPIYGMIGILRAILAHNLGKYQFF